MSGITDSLLKQFKQDIIRKNSQQNKPNARVTDTFTPQMKEDLGDIDMKKAAEILMNDSKKIRDFEGGLWTKDVGQRVAGVFPSMNSDNTYVTASHPFFPNNADGISAIKDGKTLWSKPIKNIKGLPTEDKKGNVYIVTGENVLYKMDKDGNEVIRKKFSESLMKPPSIDDDGTIYLPVQGKKIYALNPDGSEKWTYNSEYDLQPKTAVNSKGDVIFNGSWKGGAHCMDKNGNLKWQSPLDTGSSNIIILDSKDNVYTQSGFSEIYKINPDGKREWRFTTPQEIKTHPLPGKNGNLFVGCDSGWVVSINKDGRRNWQRKLPDKANVESAALTPDGTLMIGDDKGRVFGMNEMGFFVWKHDTKLGGKTKVFSGDNKVYAASGKQMEAFTMPDTKKLARQDIKEAANKAKENENKGLPKDADTTVIEGKDWIVIGGVKLPVNN